MICCLVTALLVRVRDSRPIKSLGSQVLVAGSTYRIFRFLTSQQSKIQILQVLIAAQLPDNDDGEIEEIPSVPEVGALMGHEAVGDDLHDALRGENN